MTITATRTATVPQVTVTTIPSSTTILTQVVTNTQSRDVTVTATTAITVTNTYTATSIIASASVTTTTVVATTTTIVTTTYNKVFEDNSSVYNRYVAYNIIPESLSNAAGTDLCGQQCAALPNCRFFLYHRDTSNYSASKQEAYCILDSQPFESQYRQSDVYFVLNAIAYNRGSQAITTVP